MLLQPDSSKKVVLVISGLNGYLHSLKTSPEDFIKDTCDLEMILDVENLVQEKTTIEISLFLEMLTRNEKNKQASYKISLNEFKMIN